MKKVVGVVGRMLVEEGLLETGQLERCGGFGKCFAVVARGVVVGWSVRGVVRDVEARRCAKERRLFCPWEQETCDVEGFIVKVEQKGTWVAVVHGRMMGTVRLARHMRGVLFWG